jgi:zinc transport system permease protein
MVAVLAAVTITVAMRVVGVLLVSGLMILPVAIAQLAARSFTRTIYIAMAIGAVVCVNGLSITYWHDVQPGALIVVIAVGVYALAAALRAVVTWRSARKRSTVATSTTVEG